MIGSGWDARDDVQRLTDELADVARATARLLLDPRYDEAELAELDFRARQLRASIREASIAKLGVTEPVQLHAHSQPLVSGG